MSGLTSAPARARSRTGDRPSRMPAAVVGAGLVLWLVLGLAVVDARDGLGVGAWVWIPGAVGALLSFRLRTGGVPTWALLAATQAAVAWAGLLNARADVWWAVAELALPLVTLGLLTAPSARRWCQLDRGHRRGPGRPRPARLVVVGERGGGALEYVGMTVLVTAVVGALLGTGVGTEMASTMSTKVCQVTGGGNCGGGGDHQADDDGSRGDRDGGEKGSGGDRDDAQQATSPEDKEYQDAKKQVDALEKALAGDKKKAKEAAEKLLKILADELGITDGLECLTKGDLAACGETVINILLSLVGGIAGKVLKKYGAPWKWKAAKKLIGDLRKHGGATISGLRGILKNSKALKKARERLRKAERACNHSFLPGTPVLLADGTRRRIEQVKVGDSVQVTDARRGVTTTRPVRDTITTQDDKDFTRLTVRVAAGGTATLTATDTHPFWLTDQSRWAEAGDIRTGALLRTPTGESLPVVKVNHYEKRQTTHDLSISDIHTYYVGAGSQNVLVHNCPTKKPTDPSKWKKPSWHKDLKNPRKGSADGGNGKWGSRPRNAPGPKGESWMRYQEQVSGVKRGKEYVVKNPKGGRDVEFDGWDSKRGVFLEAKNGYGGQVDKAGKFNKSTSDTFLKEAQRHHDAAGGKTTEWHFSNPKAAKAAQRLFRSKGLNIKVVHTPVKQ
ncbi:Tox-REase-5 domain-containing protein [Streptomyces sp. NPDC005438]|uniref:Tox-REase-5 domain-containing protein n=1 Tax=Streptomyces sp. NPDC005438 TaxID=3156880 RepID=UPI0033B941A9